MSEFTNSSPELESKGEATINPFIQEDQDFVNGCLPPAAILTMTSDTITVIIIRTPYARVQLRVIYGPNYPQEPPIVELASPTLPMPLLRNKEKECIDKCRETALGKAQFQTIYDQIYRFIHGNMFVPCWKEMKQIATLVEGKGQIGIDEKEGIIQLRLTCKNYKQNLKLKVPYDYPVEGVQIEFLTSNFPQDIQIMFKGQVDELVRKFEVGFTAEQAFAASTGPVKLPMNNKTSEQKVKVTTESLKNLKHDVTVLKQISDLRAAATSHDAKRYVTQANAERREARKDLRRLAKAETEAEKEQQRLLLEEEQREMQSLLRATVSETAQPSLFHCTRYLVEEYICKLPQEQCQACKKVLLAVDPEAESNKNPRSEQRAMRTFCGHWLHWNCLNDWLTTPPFVRNCELCSRRIWHPDWPEDYKQLEKAWQSKEARKREMSDVSDFMGMGDSFRA